MKRQKLATTMIIGGLGLISVLLNGCQSTPNPTTPCGVADYIEMPQGSIVKNVPLPTEPAGVYDIKAPKNGMWISLDCYNRLEKVR